MCTGRRLQALAAAAREAAWPPPGTLLRRATFEFGIAGGALETVRRYFGCAWRTVGHNHGIARAVAAPMRWLRAGRTFRLNGLDYPYLVHHYNNTWRNERCVEVAIGLELLRSVPADEVLEVGHVLRHYADSPHRVVDLYEQAPGVVNADALTYDPGRPYELILSISTLEHIGLDYGELPDPRKALAAIENLRRALRPGGRLVFTIPIGANAGLEWAIHAGRLPGRFLGLRRLGLDNRWQQVPLRRLRSVRYGRPYAFGNGLIVGEVPPLRW